MNTKYFKILASAVCALGVTSCVDLDLVPMDEQSDTSVWTTVDKAEQVVSTLYEWVPSAMWENDEDVYTDNAVHGIKWAVAQRGHGLWLATDYSWDSEYTYIRYANNVFAHIDEVPDMDQATKNNLLGQTHFFRGMIYFQLVKNFGRVPLILDVLSISDQQDVVQSDWKTVYDQVMKDYDEAIRLLPEYTTDGRINQLIARGYKARAALYFANPDCPHYVADGYKVAQEESKKIIDSGKYALYDGDYAGTAKDYTGSYAEMFWDLNLTHSKEGILNHTYTYGVNGTDFIGFECFPTTGWGGTNPTQAFVDCFEDCEGAPISKSKIYDPLHPNKNRDPRLNVNVIFPGDELYGIEVHTEPLNSSGVRALFGQAGSCGDATLTGYHARKWLNPAVDPQGDGWDHSAASAALRYTEVLLTYAEATNELTGLAPEAFDAVNKVRARVGMPALNNSDPDSPTYCATQDDLRQRIRNEWRVEFAFEGDHRQWDVRRWNIAEQVLNAPRTSYRYTLRNDPANAKEGDDGKVCDLYVGDWDVITNQVINYARHNYVFPIPQTELDLNKNFKQNEGYDY